MCDEGDLAQDRQQHEIDAALARHHAERSAVRPGRMTCLDCDEPISELRRRDGAVRCVPCANDEEKRARMRF